MFPLAPGMALLNKVALRFKEPFWPEICGFNHVPLQAVRKQMVTTRLRNRWKRNKGCTPLYKPFDETQYVLNLSYIMDLRREDEEPHRSPAPQ